MKTITIKTADLSGVALDLAVAAAIGKQPVLWDVCCGNMVGQPAECCLDRLVTVEVDMKRWDPSTDWSQGGQLIDLYQVSVVGIDREHTLFHAHAFYDGQTFDTCAKNYGPTRLIAAMRAIVRLKLGDTVDVPADLVEPNK
jgi:hypothetical protein